MRRGNGEGSISSYQTKGGVRFVVAWRVPDPRGGTKQQKQGGFATKRAAQQRLREVLADMDRGTFVVPASTTFAGYAEEWLLRQSARLKPATMKSYSRNLRRLVLPAIGQVPLQAVETRHLDTLYAQLLTTGRWDGAGLSPTTVRYVHTILGAILSDAETRGLIRRSPHRTATVPAPAHFEGRTWDAPTLRSFLAATAGTGWGSIWRVLAMTGARRGEVLGLTWPDLDLDAGRLRVSRSLVAVDAGQPVFSTPKTRSARRVIDIDAETVAALRKVKAEQAAARLAFGAGYADHGLVFASPAGTPLSPHAVYKAFLATVADLGLPRLRLHDLRHTHATLLLSSGVGVHVVSRRLGHASPSITMDIYAHVLPTADRAAADALARLVI